MKNDKDVLKKALEERQKTAEENAILLRMVQVDRDIRRSPTPTKRRQPRITRLLSKDEQRINHGSLAFVTAVYKSPLSNVETCVTRDPVSPTREVGPGDTYNNEHNCHGKDTRSR